MIAGRGLFPKPRDESASPNRLNLLRIGHAAKDPQLRDDRDHRIEIG
jgi:hypothetical protein